MSDFSSKGIKHEVVSGETFYGICKENGISNWKAALKHPNNKWLAAPDRYNAEKEHILIKPGEIVYVPTQDEMDNLSSK